MTTISADESAPSTTSATTESPEEILRIAKAIAAKAEDDRLKAKKTLKKMSAKLAEAEKLKKKPVSWWTTNRQIGGVVGALILIALAIMAYRGQLPFSGASNKVTQQQMFEAELAKFKEAFAEKPAEVDTQTAIANAVSQAVDKITRDFDEKERVAKEKADAKTLADLKAENERLRSGAGFQQVQPVVTTNATTAPSPDPAPAVSEDPLLTSMKLRHGTVMVHTEEIPPGLTWLELGQIQIPIFQNPQINNDWGFVTGDVLGGVETPPTAVPLPAGRAWVKITQANISGRAINPSGQDMSIDKALLDNALLFGTVATNQ